MTRIKLIVRNRFMKINRGFTMQCVVKILVILLLVGLHSGYLYAFENLTKGLDRKSIPSSIKKTMWNSGGGPYVADGIVETDTSNVFFWISGVQSLAMFNQNTGEVSGGWPLIRWPHLHIPPEYFQNYKNILPDDRIGEPALVANKESVGCLRNSPLRYGSLLSNSSDPVLALTLNYQLLVFSSEYQRIIFAEYYDHSDWLQVEDAAAYRQEIFRDSNDQFISALIAGMGHAEPAIRGYSKMFTGNFDN